MSTIAGGVSRHRLIFSALLLTLVTAPATVSAQPRELFRDLPAAASRPADARAIRSRLVIVDIPQIAMVGRVRSIADVARSLRLNLFPDAAFDAVLDRIDTSASGYVWVGHVAGSTSSSVTLSIEGDVMAGSIVTPEATFTIRYAGNSHVVSQVDQASYPSELPPLIPVGGQGLADDLTSPRAAVHDAQSDDGSTLDVMVLYTPAVTAFRGSDAAVRTLVNLGISETNTSYSNSGITQRLRLVYTGQAAYAESGDMGVDLDNVTTSLGALNGVAALRNTYAADLVSLWVHYPQLPACGVAWLMTNISTSFAPNAYSVVDDECVSPNYTFAHEMGHNMGARHDWYVDGGTTPRTYAHGYVYAPGRWRTIMAYNDQCAAQGFNCSRLLAWATPTRTFNGIPMGVAGGTAITCVPGNIANPPCDADDARVLNDTAFSVANFRQAVPSALTVTALTPSPASPLPVNSTVTWAVSTSGGTGPFTYKFLLFDGASWTIARDWSGSNSWSWTPTVPATYTIQVWVRNAGSSAVYDAWGQTNFSVTGPPPLRVMGLIASPPSTAPMGTQVSWTAMVTGGSGSYMMKFLVYNGVSWSIGRDWSALATWQWSPPAPGNYSVQVWARNAGSTAVYEAWLDSGTYVVTPPPALSVTSLVSTPATSAPLNTPVLWSAAATGGTGPYTYKFLLWNGSNWSVGQDWSALATWTWTPSIAGAYAVQVWARNAGSSAVYDAWRGSPTFTVTGPAPLQVTALTPDRGFPVPAGTPVTWAAAAAGGTGPYTFRFLIFNGATWSVGQDWSPANTWMWIPPAAGVYTVQVWARNAGSVAAYDSWLGAPAVTISAPAPLTVTGLTIGSPSPPFGTILPVVATAVGGLGPYTYKFLVYDGTGWSVGQDWSASSVWNWDPTVAGAYLVQVWVRNAGSVATWDAWRGAGPVSVTGDALLGTHSISR